MPKLSEKQFKKVHVPDDPTGAWVEIVYLNKPIRDLIDSESNVTRGILSEDGELQTVIEFSERKKRSLFLKEAIDSWGGFTNEKGKETKPTANNILKFSREINLYEWLSEEMEKFVEEVEGEEKPAQEN